MRHIDIRRSVLRMFPVIVDVFHRLALYAAFADGVVYVRVIRKPIRTPNRSISPFSFSRAIRPRVGGRSLHEEKQLKSSMS